MHCNDGHGRAEIAGAQRRGLETFHCFQRSTNAPAEELAARLAALAPVPGGRVFLTSGDSEAVDTAVKLSRIAHVQAGRGERTLVIGRTPSCHGVTYGAMALPGPSRHRKVSSRGIADVGQVDNDDLAAVHAALEEQPSQVAAVFADPVVGAGGVWPPMSGYLEGLRQRCGEHGPHLVLDEVICGFGRLGSMFAGEQFGVQAELAIFAKWVTSGYLPLCGLLAAPSVHEPLSGDPSFVLRHGYTYSGHETACVAALACLRVTEREELISTAAAIGARLQPQLRSLKTAWLVTDVRGVGAHWAVSLSDGVDLVAVPARMILEGVIGRPIGSPTPATCPPLVITHEDLAAVPAAMHSTPR